MILQTWKFQKITGVKKSACPYRKRTKSRINKNYKRRDAVTNRVTIGTSNAQGRGFKAEGVHFMSAIWFRDHLFRTKIYWSLFSQTRTSCLHNEEERYHKCGLRQPDILTPKEYVSKGVKCVFNQSESVIRRPGTWSKALLFTVLVLLLAWTHHYNTKQTSSKREEAGQSAKNRHYEGGRA